MKVLVTGAAGKLGSVVCAHLLEHGFELVATDRRYRDGLPAGSSLTLADLRDDSAVHNLMRGCEAVVHLGNHPSLHAAVSPQRLLAENTAMNANVFRSAIDLGLRRIVFASSVQAMIQMNDGLRAQEPLPIPYLPLDGDAPANPGVNFYGLSKEIAELLLRRLCGAHSQLAATSLRFPWLVSEQVLERMSGGGKPVPRSHFNFGELLAYLVFSDAAELVRAVLEHQAPGYHQYYPAQTLKIRGRTPAQLAAEHYRYVPLRRPSEPLEGLVDIGAITQATGWVPRHQAHAELDE